MSFAGTPVSKGLIIAIGCSTILAAASSRQHLFSVPLSPHLTRDHQFWRLFLHHLVFANSSELFLGILLLWQTAGHIERGFGSRKFASFLVVTTVFSTVVEVLLLLLGSKIGFTKIPAGPFAIIFALIYQSTRLVPSTFHWKVFGVQLPNRISLYILSLYLFISQPPLSLYVSSIGLFSAYLYRADFLHMRSYRLSSRFTLLISRFLSPFIGQTPIPHRGTAVDFGEGLRGGGPQGVMMGFTGGLGGQRVVQRPATAGGAPAAAGVQTQATQQTTQQGIVQQWAEGIGGQRQPTAQQISELSAMFPDQSREAVVSALQRSQLDVSRAVETLLASAT